MRLRHIFNNSISVENLLAAWSEFLCGKRKRKDVEQFSIHLTDNILTLHRDLEEKTYQHGPYHAFRINDPKPRDIHKASVRDRLLHHALYRVLYPYFDRKFIFDSFSCRRDKGTHRALHRFRKYAGQASQNHTRTAWILKCDIRKFFANIDHGTLLGILEREIDDGDVIWLLGQVIKSFHTKDQPNIGLPLGNLTSQLLVNIYMNEFDHFIKRQLKIKYYVRYADDFVLLHENKKFLEAILTNISTFLDDRLKLSLNPYKVSIKTFASGVDFLGWIHFPHHRILRKSTERRMWRNFRKKPKKESILSYLGLLSYGNTYKLQQQISERYPNVEK